MMSVPVNILVEGITDEPVAKKLLKHVGLQIGTVYGRNGKAHVLERASQYNQAANFAPWFVLVDLDADTQCPSEAISNWLPNPAPGMRLRIAVRAVEAWLMADRESMAKFLAIDLSKIPHQVDLDPHPKQTLVRLARGSHKKSVRDDIVPRDGSGAKVGPLYVARLADFTEHHWRPAEGAMHSKSLSHCLDALTTLVSFTPQS